MLNDGFSSPTGGKLTLSALRREFAAIFASLEELQWHIRPELEYRIQQLFGDRSLRILALAVEVTELSRARASADAAGEARNDVLSCRPVLPAPGDFDFSEIIRERAERLLVSAQDPPLDAVTRAAMTERLRLCALHIHPTLYPLVGEELRRVFAGVVCAYRHSEPEIFHAIADAAERHFPSVCREIDRNFIREAKQEIALMHAEAEELSLSYPYTLRTRVADPEWVESECRRLDGEIARLIRQKEALR